jgi:hypothetical protein
VRQNLSLTPFLALMRSCVNRHFIVVVVDVMMVFGPHSRLVNREEKMQRSLEEVKELLVME